MQILWCFFKNKIASCISFDYFKCWYWTSMVQNPLFCNGDRKHFLCVYLCIIFHIGVTFFSGFMHICGAIGRMLFDKTRLVYLIHLLFSMLDCFACFLSLNFSKMTFHLADFILYLWCLLFFRNAFCLHMCHCIT